MGYVWCDGYVWDMCGVRYANNLLKNPATKRLSGTKKQNFLEKFWLQVKRWFLLVFLDVFGFFGLDS